MRILAWLHDTALGRVRAASEPIDELMRVRTIEELARALADGRRYIVVIDPTMAGAMRTDGWAGLRRVLRGSSERIMRLIVYTVPCASSLRAVADLATAHPVEIVSSGSIDELPQLRAALELTRTSAGGVLGVRLEAALERVPSRLRRAVVRAATQPDTVDSVGQLVFLASQSERTVERWLSAAGLAGPRRVLAAARIAWAHDLLRERRARVAVIAKRVGFATARNFREATKRAAGCTPTELAGASAEEVASLLLERLQVRSDRCSRRERAVSDSGSSR